ncbi:SecY family transport protein [Paenarthrobacter aromaticivorans]|uniref:SecY family transport protein n=1 Tax=Paenarthrobacter aromaticivorans TaxID=2849150 RepID=A0ABS6I981_9MICC|nr:SecY family transport protein [Paenarthrobacter sp. MMS21-TAE1-1]MBU8868280.1 SecY family transport protein [Paenarthrobacter sp. MMS21-TAE1-1]
MGAVLAVLALANAATGNGESILIFIGLAASLTGLYSLIFKRSSWAALPSKQAAIMVAVAGAAALFLGVVAAGTEAARDSAVAAARQAPSTTQDGTIQDGTIQDGTRIVGRDIAPGTYRTTHEVSRSCSWQITRPGSIDSSEGAVTGGFPVVKLVRGQRFITEGCGGWAKQ